MTETTQAPARSDVERAVSSAVRAPSVHNTQPWQWVHRDGVLELYADRTRQLPALDPDGRAVLLSCGAALELARLGFAADGWRTEVDRMSDPARPDLLARIRPVGRTAVDPVTVERAQAAERRRTDRRPFRPEPVAAETVNALLAVAAGRDHYAYAVQRADERLDLAVVFSWADELELADPAYQAELESWTRYPGADAPDGVPASAVPRVAAGEARHTDVPVRDFEAGITGGQEFIEVVDERPVYLVVFTTGDDAGARLRAGEVYARISVEAERLGLASSAMTQAVDLPAVRERFRALMGWPDHPQMVLRVGHPQPGPTPPPTGRRPLSAVLRWED
ncbi:MAG TPA: nitroreductase family protein [Mycobacteriales bacterium]|nr:nitroreductase family protein [Mycobacteriales bacterium]